MSVESKTKPASPCRPSPCPPCRLPQALERPRFFCGQLLSDQDLSSLIHYLLEKNRLHNRHFLGTGVVCGLLIHCDPCAGRVRLDPGHAIDCCGNDILVTEPTVFDVLEYLKACLAPKKPACEETAAPPPPECEELPREYCLFISYREEPSRPLTALIPDGCGQVSRCEPSRLRETFRLDLIPADQLPQVKPPNFWAQVLACWTGLFKLWEKYLGQILVLGAQGMVEAQEHQALLGLLCRLRDDFLKLYETGPNNRCDLARQFNQLLQAFPAYPSDPAAAESYQQDLYEVYFQVFALLAQYLIDCFCAALSPPCPACPEDDPGVLLAGLTMINDRIVKICNTVRTYLWTGPTLRYWLQPLFQLVGDGLEHLCCDFELIEILGQFFKPAVTTAPGAFALEGTVPMANPVQRMQQAVKRFQQAGGIAASYRQSLTELFHPLRLVQVLTSPGLTTLDLYGRSAAEVQELLAAHQVKAKAKQTTMVSEAYSLRHLGRMRWQIPPGAKVELVVSPDQKVTAVRLVEED